MENERSLTKMFWDLAVAAGWYGMGMALRQAIGFFLLPIYTRYLPPVSLGVLSLFGMAQLFLTVIFTLGFTPAMFRFGADPEITGRFGRGNILSTVIIVLLIWNGLLGSAFFITAGWWANLLFGDPGWAGIIRALSFLLISESLGMGCFAGNVLRLKERASAYVLLSVAQVALQLSVAYMAVVRLGQGLWGAVWAMVVASVFASLFAFAMVYKELSWGWSFPILKEMLRYSLVLIPGLLAMGVLDVADRYILRLLLGLELVGIYEAGYRIGKLVNFVLVPFSAALPPLLYSLGTTQRSRFFLARISTYMMMLSLSAAALVSIFAREITSLVAGSEYASSWSVVPWIAFGTAAFHMANIFTGGLHFAKRAELLSTIQLSFAGVAITFCFILVPIMGILGAAITTLATYGGMSLALLWLSQRVFLVPYEYKRMILTSLLATITLWLSHEISEKWVPLLSGLAKMAIWASLFVGGLILTLDSSERRFIVMRWHYGKMLFKTREVGKKVPAGSKSPGVGTYRVDH